jgi:hypothetical protein
MTKYEAFRSLISQRVSKPPSAYERRPADPRQQLDPAAVQAGVHAIAVVLDLVEPIRALRSRVYQLAKLWLDPLWKIGRRAAWPICRQSRHRSLEIKLAARNPE